MEGTHSPLNTQAGWLGIKASHTSNPRLLWPTPKTCFHGREGGLCLFGGPCSPDWFRQEKMVFGQEWQLWRSWGLVRFEVYFEVQLTRHANGLLGSQVKEMRRTIGNKWSRHSLKCFQVPQISERAGSGFLTETSLGHFVSEKPFYFQARIKWEL